MPVQLAVTSQPRGKPRAVVFGGGIGMFPSLMHRFKEVFEVVALFNPRYPALYSWLFLFRSFRFSKREWYRNWKSYIEHSPFSFRVNTRVNDSQIAKLGGEYDVILFLGAQNAPALKPDKPVFVFTDSCRRLSSLNKYDDSCRFRDADEEREWFELEGGVYRSARRVFVGSQFVKNALVDFYGVPARRVVVTGFGAGEGFGEVVPKAFDGRTILYIGKGDFEKKGGLALLRAFARVRAAIPDAVLHIVGQDELPRVEGVVNEGFVRDRKRLIELMRAAHVFALPSLVDRFGIALVEAMATATPCVTSDYGAMPEVVDDAGLIVPCDDDEKLAAAIIKLLRDVPLSTQLGLIGRKRYEERYNWDSIWQIMHAEIESGLAESA